MKFNAKLGGVNHTVTGRTINKLKERGVMFVGADVTHPGFASIPWTPSIAGVVASVGELEVFRLRSVTNTWQILHLRDTLLVFVCRRAGKR